MDKDAPYSIAGKWLGTYSYDASNGPTVTFEVEIATLSEGGRFAGTAVDYHRLGEASISGRQYGPSVEFTKVYTHAHPNTAPVYYTGTMSQDGRTIHGSWQLDLRLFGIFPLATTGTWEAHRSEEKAADPGLEEKAQAQRRTLIYSRSFLHLDS